MAKAKAQTWQQKAAQEREERAKQIKLEAQEQYRQALERRRLFEEQEAARTAALTPEEKEAEEAAEIEHEQEVRNIQIATAEARQRPIVETGLRRPIHLQDEE